MELRMKNFNVFGVHWKIRFLGGGGGSRKTNIEGGLLGQFADLRVRGWGLGKKEGDGVFEVGRGDTPVHTMNINYT